MKYFYLLLFLAFLFSFIGCGSNEKESGIGSKRFELILSDELKNLDIKVIDQSIRELGNGYISFYIIFNKDVSSLIHNGVLIFRVLSKDNYELVSGFLNKHNIEIGDYKNEEGLPDNILKNRAFVYSQGMVDMDINLIKSIKLEVYRK